MKCECGKQAVIFRPYEGRALCQGHFISSVEQKIAKMIVRHKMIVKGDKILIALSGDPASATLATVLTKLYGQRPNISFVSLSIDGMPGTTIASDLAQRLKISHKVVSLKAVGTYKMGDLAIARRWIINKEARRLAATKIAIATTLDDEAQSVLLNFLRGDVARLARLGPITGWSVRKTKAKLFIPRIKPLRDIPKTEIELYARLAKIPHKKTVQHDGMRDELSVFLKRLERAHPGVCYSIIRTVDRLLPAIQKIAEEHEGPIILCKLCGEPGSQSPCRTCQLFRKNLKGRV